MKTKSRSTHQLPALEFMAYIRSPQQKSFIADRDVGARLAIIAVLSVFATACSDLPTTQSVLKRGPRYELSGSGLIPLPGAGLDINDQDWVVGTTMEGQAFLWRDGYPIQELGPDAALGLNSTNQIVGGEWFPRPLFPGDDNEHFAGPLPFSWINGIRTVLPELPGPSEVNDYPTRAVAINDAGIIVGYGAHNPDLEFGIHGLQETHAIRWDHGVATDLGGLADDIESSWAVAINSQGVIAGSSHQPPRHVGQVHAVIWENDVIRDLNASSPSDWSWSTDINDLNQVVGYRAIDGGLFHAFFWEDGTTTDLGTLGGGNSWAVGITNGGAVVGMSDNAIGERHLFVWTKANGMVDLGNPGGADNVVAVNNHLHAIVTNGMFGVINGYLYQIPLDAVAPRNTPAGTGVSVTPVVSDSTNASISMTFGEVISPGTTSVTAAAMGGGSTVPAPSGFRIGESGTFYEVATTATFSGPVELCFSYNDADFGAESELRLLHYSNQAWVDITSTGYPDVANNRICGTTTSFSPFLIGEINQRPSMSGIDLPSAPVALGTPVNVIARFTDANKRDTHSGTLKWGDGTEDAAIITESGGTGNLRGTHTFGTAGVYTITATVTDGSLSDSRASSSDVPAYIVAYDPSGGYVTGGGWFVSPAGAYAALPNATGKATFGFVAKYVKGKTAPEGTTEFLFATTQLKFVSTSYDWLVVSGSKATYRGTGTVNGSSNYKFVLSAIDGGSDGLDRLRIKIWNDATGSVIYDNQSGSDDDANPLLGLASGSIVIHK